MPRKKTATKAEKTMKKAAEKPVKEPLELSEEQREQKRKKRALNLLVASLFITVVGVFLAICVYFGSGVGKFGNILENFLRGCFGGGALILPLAVIIAGIDIAVHSKEGKVRAAVYVYFAAVLLFGAILQMFFCPIAVSDLYAAGQESYASGGVIGGFLTAVLYDSIGVVGLSLLYFAAVMACVVVLCYPLFTQQKQPVSEEDKPKAAPEITRFPVENKTDDAPAFEEPQKPKKITFREPKKASALERLVDGEDEPLQEHVAEPVRIEDKKKVTKQDTLNEEAKVSNEIEKTLETDTPPYVFPPTSLLKKDMQNGTAQENYTAVAEKIVDKLRSFGIETTPISYSRGPVVTRYEFALAEGIRISKITGLSSDIALAISATSDIRIEAPIPGKSAIGFEVPNKEIRTVYLRTLIEDDKFKEAKNPLTFAIGDDISGTSIFGNIDKMPHMLIAGATGSGKSVCINSLIVSILYKATPEEVRFIMIDPKMVELGIYNGIPHLLVPVVTDPKKASGTLAWAVGEMTKRYTMFAECGVKDLKGYNAFAETHPEYPKMPRIVIIIDELADLMMVARKEVENSIARITQLARAAGMHLVVATQRPSVDVITGLIKSNIPSRIAFMVSQQVDSRTILDAGGAEKLLGRGDMLYAPAGAKHPVRIQGCLVEEEEVKSVIDFIKEHASADYDEEVSRQIENLAVESDKKSGTSILEADDSSADDPMLDQAIECVVESNQASTSYLQRRLGLGYARAARIMDTMEERGIIGPFNGSKAREVLITKEQFLEMRMRKDDLQDGGGGIE